MSGCPTCGGYGDRHEPYAHDAETKAQARCVHDWMEFGGPGDEWRECFLCGLVVDA